MILDTQTLYYNLDNAWIWIFDAIKDGNTYCIKASKETMYGIRVIK